MTADGWIFDPRKFIITILGLLTLCLVVLLIAGSRNSDLRDLLLKGNYQTAYPIALDAARNGDLTAQNTIGNLYYLGLGVKKDYRLAAKWYLKAALAGYGPSQANLGNLYSQGLGVPKDTIQTVGWYWLSLQGGYKKIGRKLKRTRDENHFNALMIEKAKSLFSSLDKVKKRFEKNPNLKVF